MKRLLVIVAACLMAAAAGGQISDVDHTIVKWPPVELQTGQPHVDLDLEALTRCLCPTCRTLSNVTVSVSVVTDTNDVPRWTAQTYYDMGAGWTMWIDELSEGLPLVDQETGETTFVRLPVNVSGDFSQENQKERVRIVQTRRITTLAFDWNGKHREIVDVVTLGEKRTKLVPKWEEQP